MLPLTILKILKENEQIQQFLIEAKDFELFMKHIDPNEFERLINEYPDFLPLLNNKQKTLKQELEIKTLYNSILCLTFIIQDKEDKNFIKLKKIKLYIDELNGKILKFLKS